MEDNGSNVVKPNVAHIFWNRLPGVVFIIFDLHLGKVPIPQRLRRPRRVKLRSKSDRNKVRFVVASLVFVYHPQLIEPQSPIPVEVGQHGSDQELVLASCR